MASSERFKLSELRLDHQNYRLGQTATQRDAIAAMISDQKGKLVALAEDIISLGLSPGEPIWVTRDTEVPGMYTVLEGNRRITALKILETPTLADGTQVEADFVALGRQYAMNPIPEIFGMLFGNREEAAPWQRRRHMSNASGVGLVRWEALAKARANRDQGLKAPRFLAVVDFLQDESDRWSSLQDVLDSKWTTVDRVLNRPSLSSVLGISIDPKSSSISFGNGDADAGRKLLLSILDVIASSAFKFSEIEHDGDRDNFIARFSAQSVCAKSPPPSGKIPSGTTHPPASPAVKPLRTKSVPLQVPARTTLAPKTGPKTFKVSNDRLAQIYTI